MIFVTMYELNDGIVKNITEIDMHGEDVQQLLHDALDERSTRLITFDFPSNEKGPALDDLMASYNRLNGRTGLYKLPLIDGGAKSIASVGSSNEEILIEFEDISPTIAIFRQGGEICIELRALGDDHEDIEPLASIEIGE